MNFKKVNSQQLKTILVRLLTLKELSYILLKLTYYAGAAWNKGLDFKTATEWMTYLEKHAKGGNL
jgi:hypothetical protein